MQVRRRACRPSRKVARLHFISLCCIFLLTSWVGRVELVELVVDTTHARLIDLPSYSFISNFPVCVSECLFQGNIVDPGTTNFGVNVAGFILHSAIHAARPDAKCVIHVHHPACVAVSVTWPFFLMMDDRPLSYLFYLDSWLLSVDSWLIGILCLSGFRLEMRVPSRQSGERVDRWSQLSRLLRYLGRSWGAWGHRQESGTLEQSRSTVEKFRPDFAVCFHHFWHYFSTCSISLFNLVSLFSRQVMFLRNHGLAVLGETIEEAFSRVYDTVLACESQIRMMPVGIDNLIQISDEAKRRSQVINWFRFCLVSVSFLMRWKHGVSSFCRFLSIHFSLVAGSGEKSQWIR